MRKLMEFNKTGEKETLKHVPGAQRYTNSI